MVSQFQPQEDVWKPEAESEPESESEPEWESEWRPKIPRKKYKRGEYIKGKTSIYFLQHDERRTVFSIYQVIQSTWVILPESTGSTL